MVKKKKIEEKNIGVKNILRKIKKKRQLSMAIKKKQNEGKLEEISA